jgi:hypothetical protein
MLKGNGKELRARAVAKQGRRGNTNALLWSCALLMGMSASHAASASELLQQVARPLAA